MGLEFLQAVQSMTSELGKSIIERLIAHLDKKSAVPATTRDDLTDPKTERRILIEDWLMMECFGRDHQLYDDIMTYLGSK